MTETKVIACPACNRNNGVHRVTCIYCGFSLPVEAGRETEKLPNLRQLEETELGFNLVCFPSDSLSDDSALQEIETVTRLEPIQVSELMRATVPVPIARAQTRSDADIFYKRLLAAGVRTTIIGDDELSVAIPPFRVRRIKPMGDVLELWSNELTRPETIAWKDISLFVFGAVRYTQVSTQEETRSRRNGREIKDLSESIRDEFLFDFFDRATTRHFRLRGDSFDYSCLGPHRTMLASENYKRLEAWLIEGASGAVVSREFRRLSRALESVWPLNKTILRQPLKRIGVGKVAFQSDAYYDNEGQFTRFSRTLFRLYQKGLYGK
jgi:hypothetical protein